MAYIPAAESIRVSSTTFTQSAQKAAEFGEITQPLGLLQMSSGHQRIKWRRNIAENFNRLSRVHERYRQTTDGRTTTYREHEHEFTFVRRERFIARHSCFNAFQFPVSCNFTYRYRSFITSVGRRCKKLIIRWDSERELALRRRTCIQNTIESCINSATDRLRYVLERIPQARRYRGGGRHRGALAPPSGNACPPVGEFWYFSSGMATLAIWQCFIAYKSWNGVKVTHLKILCHETTYARKLARHRSIVGRRRNTCIQDSCHT